MLVDKCLVHDDKGMRAKLYLLLTTVEVRIIIIILLPL